MSFDNDPYRNMDVVVLPDGQRCRWRCQSCGGDWSCGWSTDVSVSELITSFYLHVGGEPRIPPNRYLDLVVRERGLLLVIKTAMLLHSMYKSTETDER